ncbi:MAG TPA: alginate lyase family protein [Pyrinomonadaceae bacterium]|nr:alginate lyase family protein [Pyrinomonadaceae bacterium]
MIQSPFMRRLMGVLATLRRLKGRSAGELRVRGAQALSARAERLGLDGRARLPSDKALFSLMGKAGFDQAHLTPQSLLDHFRTRTRPRFFASFDDKERTIETLRERVGARASEIVIEKAERIIEGRFDLLGHRELHFGQPPDWHLEPVAGLRTPRLHWSRIEYLDAGVAGDKKIVWELNRHQYFATLGRAYWQTRDERYAEVFASHLESWMDENPPKLGINWSSSLEVSFRAISWLWAFNFFKDSPHLRPALFMRALKYLYLHGRHLETYLSTYFSPNTHLTGEALGLYYLGMLLPEFERAARWRETGLKVLDSALDFQMRSDGVYFEQASYYHRYTTDFYTHLYLLSKINEQPLESKFVDKLSALLDHLMYLTMPDGTTPLFGDDDGGRLVMLDERPMNDFRSTLATAAALFQRSDYKYVAEEGTEETLWLLGPVGLKAFDDLKAEPPADESRAFRESGYFVMRDGWTKTSNYLLVDCGPHGTANCGHAHADALSIELAAKGRTLLVDPGTYTYTGSAEMRDLFRSSLAHNTLVVDGESSSIPAGPFQWKHVARTTLRAWHSHAAFDYFEGAHDGYERLPQPATHTRSLLFLKDRYWIMRDRASAQGAHQYDLRFHFSADATPFADETGNTGAVRESWNEKSGLEIFAFGGGGWTIDEGWVSSCYGEREAAPVYNFSATVEGEQEFFTFLIPREAKAAKSAKTVVQERDAVRGRLFELELAGWRDCLLAGDGSLIETERFRSDFKLAWVRFAEDGARVEELLLIGGSRFLLDGLAIFDSARPTGYIFARRAGEELLLETDEKEVSRLPLPDGEASNSRVYSF